MPQKCYFRPKNWHFSGKKSGFLVMVAPEPLVICSKTLQNALHSVQHPQNRVWGPKCDHSGRKNTVLGQKMAFCGHLWPKNAFLLAMAALKPLIVCSKTLQNILF